MKVKDMIDFLRLNVSIQDKNGTVVNNEEYLALTDDQLKLYMQVAKSKSFSAYSLENFPEEKVYPLMLVTKRELYMALAVKVAPEYDMTADNNNVLREHQMYQAYRGLIQEVDRQYAEYLAQEDSGTGAIVVSQLLVNTRYHTKRNQDHGQRPILYVRLHGIYADRVEVSWDTTFNRFLSYEVRIMPFEPTYTAFPEGNQEERFNPKARLVANIVDAHTTSCLVRGLAPNTEYYLSVVVRERNGLFTVQEVSFITESR